MQRLLWESNSTMSVELCAHIAHQEEHAYFAVEWGRECWGGGCGRGGVKGGNWLAHS